VVDRRPLTSAASTREDFLMHPRRDEGTWWVEEEAVDWDPKKRFNK